MPNIKSAKKRVLQNAYRRSLNVARKSAVRTAVKKVKDALAGNDVTSAKALLKDAEAKIARAAGKGVFHKNAAKRRISRLAKKVAAATRS